jgi:hypothetical protein
MNKKDKSFVAATAALVAVAASLVAVAAAATVFAALVATAAAATVFAALVATTAAATVFAALVAVAVAASLVATTAADEEDYKTSLIWSIVSYVLSGLSFAITFGWKLDFSMINWGWFLGIFIFIEIFIWFLDTEKPSKKENLEAARSAAESAESAWSARSARSAAERKWQEKELNKIIKEIMK